MGQIVRRKKKGRPSKADLARRAVVRRGHPEVTTKLGTAVVNGGGSRRGEPSSSLYVSSLFAWVVVDFSDRHDLLGNQSDGGGGGGGGWFSGMRMLFESISQIVVFCVTLVVFVVLL
uniref:Uncharacterized protein n=1 Tax=Fagus sylvatica TaxID=28930 RepID=A0A2N9EHI9_FAGSY